MKKFFTLILLSISIFAFAACNKSEVNEEVTTQDQTASIPKETEDEYDINLDNALLELDLVD